MKEALQDVEKSIAETWWHLDRQRHIVAILQEHGYLLDVPTAEAMLQALTASLEVLCERKAILLDEMRRPTGSSTGLRIDLG